MERVERAGAILRRFRPGEYEFLGSGFAGVVFHDARWVYKVHLPLTPAGGDEPDPLAFLAANLRRFDGARHFYPLREFVRQNGVAILVYPYEPSEPVTEATEDEWCSYLAEMWSLRVISRSVKLATNFRRVGGVLKLIDYEIEPHDDNLFLNVAARAFIQLPHVAARVANFQKLRRSMINRFDLPELDGFFPFLSRVGDAIAARERTAACVAAAVSGAPETAAESQAELRALLYSNGGELDVSVPVDAIDPSATKFDALRAGMRLRTASLDRRDATQTPTGALRMRLRFTPLQKPSQPVSLVVKACIQDAEHLEIAVRHVVGAISGPEQFAERLLALDLVPRVRFVRQYTASGTRDELLAAADRLVAAGVVDRVVRFEAEAGEARAVNERWFGLSSDLTHTAEGVPVASQLHAIEASRCDAVLQVDVDALIGVRNPDHATLGDMLGVLADRPEVVSAAFPICRALGAPFQEYFGFDSGGFVPEVRCCLLLRSRLEALRPLPNEALVAGLARSWYRAVEVRQRETGACSVRGGSTARYFVHPQNYRKAAPSTWPALIDRIEHGWVPEIQCGQPEVRGSLLDWSLPKRAEEAVVLVVIEDEPPSSVARLLLDLLSQSTREFGLLIVDASGRRLSAWLARALSLDASRCTTVDHHARVVKPIAVLDAVRRFITRPDALVVMLDAADVLLRRDALADVQRRAELYDADVVIGKELSADWLVRLGKHSIDLVEPRRDPLGLADGIRAVRRHLLDALDVRDVRAASGGTPDAGSFARLSRSLAGVDDPGLLTIVVPAIELSRNPIRSDHFNVLRRRPRDLAAASVTAIRHLLSRPRKREGDGVGPGRKTFAPNLRRIEIDITYDCNLKCVACNRSCTQAPTRQHMSLEQVRAFVAEAVALKLRFELINILGGEPTLHPDFQAIVRLLLGDYVDVASPATIVQVTSNGFGDFVRRQLAALPDHPQLVVNRDSFKDSEHVPYFTPFNDAPLDDPAFANADFRRGCWVTSYCGIGLNHLGYFACSVAGGIERLIGARNVVKSLAEVDASIAEMLATYCRFCGNFKHYEPSRGDFVPRSEKDVCEDPVVSPTWRRIYEQVAGSEDAERRRDRPAAIHPVQFVERSRE